MRLMRHLVLVLLLMPLPLLAQAPLSGPVPARMRYAPSVWSQAREPAFETTFRLAFERRTANWVKGGLIGAAVGAGISVGVTSLFDQIDHGKAPYLTSALIGAFGGFILGALIAGE